VPTEGPVHADRSRAESFGSVAAAYDRYRPNYPDALIGDLAESGARRVLDIACGTGKLSVALLACGMAVLGVEIDPEMAEIAGSHGILVEVGAFETWDDEGRTFDLITCGQGWHWIDPARGIPKAARLLEPGGTIVLAWNYAEPDDDIRAALDAVYREHAPELARRTHAHDEDDEYAEQLESSGLFASVRTHRYKWTMTLTTDQWIGTLGTYSDHIALPAEQRERLLAAVRRIIDERGGSLTSDYRTYTIFATIPE
jgi:SAM-dependent methyltransferase